MRTIVNIRAGGRTPVSGMTHSVVLMAIALGAPLACSPQQLHEVVHFGLAATFPPPTSALSVLSGLEV